MELIIRAWSADARTFSLFNTIFMSGFYLDMGVLGVFKAYKAEPEEQGCAAELGIFALTLQNMGHKDSASGS